jgi:hypothetical protein
MVGSLEIRDFECSFQGCNGGGCWISASKTPSTPGKAPTIDDRSTLASSEGSGSDGGGGWESTREPPPVLGKPSTSDDESTLATSELGGSGSTLAASKRGGGVPWMWAHSASMNMRTKCWLSHGGTQSRAHVEDVAPEDRLKGEGESRCNGEPDRFIVSVG